MGLHHAHETMWACAKNVPRMKKSSDHHIHVYIVAKLVYPLNYTVDTGKEN